MGHPNPYVKRLAEAAAGYDTCAKGTLALNHETLQVLEVFAYNYRLHKASPMMRTSPVHFEEEVLLILDAYDRVIQTLQPQPYPFTDGTFTDGRTP